MSSPHLIDDRLVRRLPSPLAQLYLQAHRAQTTRPPVECYLAACHLWEASLRLLGTVAVIEYAERADANPDPAGGLTALARPTLGAWWGFVRQLAPVLAADGDGGFAAVDALVFHGARDDLPRAAGLDAALGEVLGERGPGSGARATVRPDKLLERLVQHRNHEIGHGAAGQRGDDFYGPLGRALLAGAAEVLGRCDVLAGRRLVLITDVRQSDAGEWLVERRELCGESGQVLSTLVMPAMAAAALPRRGRLYLEVPAPSGDGVQRRHGLHPLLTCDAEAGTVLFWNGRGKNQADYLCYTTGRHTKRSDWTGERRPVLARALNAPEPPSEPPAAAPPPEEPPAEEPAPELPRRLGEFEVLGKLGQGGCGVVYRAWQPSLRRQVALKVLLWAGKPTAEARFRREILSLGRVEHPHLVKVFTADSQGDQWFYAMELVEGATLAALCDRLQSRSPDAADLGLDTWQAALSTICEASRQSGTLPRPGAAPAPPGPAADTGRAAVPGPPASRSYVSHIAELARQAAEAAHALHEAGIVHRDIKPGNILVGPDGGRAVLMDLGVAQLTGDAEEKLTRTRDVVGTLRYASPEQVLAAGPVDRRSDVYSLGATLWEMLTLRPLLGITGDLSSPAQVQRVMRLIQFEDPEPVRKYNRRVPADLEAIVLKCLEKNPKRRYATAQDLGRDLQRFLDGDPVEARPVGRVRRALRRAAGWVKRRPVLALEQAAGAVLVLAVAGLVWFLLTRPVPPPPPPSPVTVTLDPDPDPDRPLPPDLALVPADAFGFASLRVADVLQAPEGKKLLELLAQADPQAGPLLDDKGLAALQTLLDLKLADVERATLVLLEPSPDERSALVIAATTRPYSEDERRRLAAWPRPFALRFLNERVFLAGTSDDVLRAFAARTPVPQPRGPLATALRLADQQGPHAIVAVNPSRPLLDEWARSMHPRYEDLLPLTEMQSAVLSLGLQPPPSPDGGVLLRLYARLLFADEAAALRGQKGARQALEPLQRFMDQYARPEAIRPEDLARLGPLSPLALAALRFVKPVELMLPAASVERRGDTVHGLLSVRIDTPDPVLVDRDRIWDAINCSRSADQLQRIGRALQDYNKANGHLPPAALRGPGGKPLLSWRVQLLPQLGEEELCKQFRLDEPWDGPHNQALLDKMPRVYAVPGAPAAEAGATYYQVIVGPGTLFEDGREIGLDQVAPDRRKGTALVVEAARAVPWSKPEDLTYAPGGPVPALGGLFKESGFNALFADGSSRFVRGAADAKAFRALVTGDGGERVGPDKMH